VEEKKAQAGGGFHNTYASPPPYMPTQPTWFNFPDSDIRWRGASGLSTTSTAWRGWQRRQAFPRLIATWGWVTTSGITNKARSILSGLALLWRWTHHLSWCCLRPSDACPRGQGLRECFSASSVTAPRMPTGVNAAPVSISTSSFSAANRGTGQTVPVPHVAPSVEAHALLPDA